MRLRAPSNLSFFSFVDKIKNSSAFPFAWDDGDRGKENITTKSQLTSYYSIYCPEKVHNIDKILKLFNGRYDVLNKKLQRKVRIQISLSFFWSLSWMDFEIRYESHSLSSKSVII